MVDETGKKVNPLSAKDDPENVITKVALTGKNYDEWSRRVQTSLRAKRKIGFIDGSVTAPAAGQMTVEQYSATIQKLWEDLAQIEPKSSCTCAHKAEAERLSANKKLHQFLLGLDGSICSTVRTNILNTVSLPSIDQAYNMVIQEKQLRRADRVIEQRTEATAFAVQPMEVRTQQPEVYNPLVCTFCSKNGHTVDICWKKHGMPWPGNYGRGTGRGRGASQPGTPQQNSGRNFQQNMGRGRGQNAITNLMAVGGSDGKSLNTELLAQTGLKQEQWEKLV
ncbi:hypothetical protein AALP_AAs48168U000200 [Arabis alpina]|uniref:Retrotransposon Copia-like N-terminal domain-containing protein n=1 Tax=Arabis alpina TaxID=50452 RepID=A0A087G1E1_ARAAL|nr:hypothetical protein AALP_AAs48168U000200 [Arabis alpina]